jgi:hypothetical protein
VSDVHPAVDPVDHFAGQRVSHLTATIRHVRHSRCRCDIETGDAFVGLLAIENVIDGVVGHEGRNIHGKMKRSGKEDLVGNQ